MHVLQMHKFFYPHAGTETALFDTRDLLLNKGHHVIDFSMRDERNMYSEYAEHFTRARSYESSLPIKRRVLDGAASVYSVSSRRSLRGLLDVERVDVAHMHLISHQLTFSVLDELVSRNIPSVLTLHDYKIGCPAYTLYRDGNSCYECVGRTVPIGVAKHSCIKGSRVGSLLALAESSLAKLRSSWEKIDVIIAPSKFAAHVAISSGYPEDRVRVVPNYMKPELISPDEATTSMAPTPTFFMAGRLEEVKGFKWVLETVARLQPDFRVKLAGAGGSLEQWIRQFTADRPNLTYLGRLSRDALQLEMRNATATVIPSLWDENYPYSMLEARAAGSPVIATRVGGLQDMVEHGHDGLLIDPGNEEQLIAAMRRVASDPSTCQRMRSEGRRRIRTENSPESHYDGLMSAYDTAISRRG